MRAAFASVCLRLGIAFVFVVAAVSAFISPQNWVGYLPSFAVAIIPANILLALFGFYEIILSLFILLKKDVHWPALLAFLTFISITVFNITLFDIVFRDVGLALAALALFFIGKIKA